MELSALQTQVIFQLSCFLVVWSCLSHTYVSSLGMLQEGIEQSVGVKATSRVRSLTMWQFHIVQPESGYAFVLKILSSYWVPKALLSLAPRGVWCRDTRWSHTEAAWKITITHITTSFSLPDSLSSCPFTLPSSFFPINVFHTLFLTLSLSHYLILRFSICSHFYFPFSTCPILHFYPTRYRVNNFPFLGGRKPRKKDRGEDEQNLIILLSSWARLQRWCPREQKKLMLFPGFSWRTGRGHGAHWSSEMAFCSHIFL